MSTRAPTLFLVLLAALAACACGSERSGVRRMAKPQSADVAMARRAALEGNWELAASAWYEIYLRNGEEAPMACVEAARALVELEDTTSARNLLDQGLKQFPWHPDLLEMQGNVLVRAGFRRAAEPYYQQALQYAPERASTLLALARVRVDLGLEEAALPLLEKRVALGGGDAETWLLIARARRAQGSWLAALQAYAKSFELGESRSDRLVYGASLYLELSEEERSQFDANIVEGWLLRACEVDPQSTAVHGTFGEFLELRGDLERAQRCYTRAVECDPAHLPSLRRLGKLMRKRGDLAGAAALAERALKLDKGKSRSPEWQLWIDQAAAAAVVPPPGG